MSVIKKIKQEAKKVNGFGLAGLVVAGGLAMGFTPDKPTAQTQLWGKNPSTGVWQNITGMPEDAAPPYASGSYRCDLAENSCTVLSATQPPNGSNPSGARQGAFIAQP